MAMLSLSPAAEAQVDRMQSEFLNPPSEARPQVWWHWMNGNITRDGIYKDITWMHRAGITGFHVFDAGIGTPQIVEKRITYMTPEWKECLRYSLHLADSLGMSVTIPSSPGWSNTGGPWVTRRDAMKKIVWSTRTIQGGCGAPGRYRAARSMTVLCPRLSRQRASIRTQGPAHGPTPLSTKT